MNCKHDQSELEISYSINNDMSYVDNKVSQEFKQK
jgi:hypothetical protein